MNINENYFKENLNNYDGKSFALTYPVVVKAVRIDWIINSKSGFLLLKSIFDRRNLQIYEVQSIQLIIQFLFERVKQTYV
jgi:hypothetical protein